MTGTLSLRKVSLLVLIALATLAVLTMVGNPDLLKSMEMITANTRSNSASSASVMVIKPRGIKKTFTGEIASLTIHSEYVKDQQGCLFSGTLYLFGEPYETPNDWKSGDCSSPDRYLSWLEEIEMWIRREFDKPEKIIETVKLAQKFFSP